MQRLSGKNFTVTVGDLRVNVDKASIEITDNSAVAFDNGVPNGYVDGDVSASGEMEVDLNNFALIKEAAKSAGSYREMPTFDILFYGKTPSGEEDKIEAFGCRIKLASLLDMDKKGGEKLTRKLPFDVTSPDFIRIGGVPYLSEADTEGLL